MKPKKMGRPPLSESNKDILIGARFGKEEARIINETVRASGLAKSEWIRAKLLNTLPAMIDLALCWGELPFPQNEMHGKTVEFKLVATLDGKPPRPIGGDGRFFIRKSKEGLRAQIVVETGPNRETVIDLTEEMVLQTKRNPEGADFEFNLNLLER